jgi:hypothetical protein
VPIEPGWTVHAGAGSFAAPVLVNAAGVGRAKQQAAGIGFDVAGLVDVDRHRASRLPPRQGGGSNITTVRRLTSPIVGTRGPDPRLCPPRRDAADRRPA